MSKKKKHTIIGIRGRRFVYLKKDPMDDTWGLVVHLQNGGRRLTKRQVELLMENNAHSLAHHFIGSKFASLYEKARYGKCWKSEKKRKAVDFLRDYRYAQIYGKESGQPFNDSDLFEPLRRALNAFDAEFVDGLAEAMRMLDVRMKSYPKGSDIGSGDPHLDKFLLEYAITLPLGRAEHTVRELNQQEVSKFRKISDRKLRAKCKKLAVPLNADARGKAAERYGQRSK